MQRGPDSTVSLAILLSPPPSLIPDKHHDPLPVCDLLSWTLTSINRFYLDCCYNVLQLPCPQRQQRTAHGLPCDSSARADSAPCAKGSPRPQWTISQKPHFYPKLLLSNVCGCRVSPFITVGPPPPPCTVLPPQLLSLSFVSSMVKEREVSLLDQPIG